MERMFAGLKPGGHLLSFGGTRTYHRMACAIEDAGFEIRDQMQWVYAGGFPKGQNISKAIDKKLGVKRKVIGISNKQPAGFIRHGRTDEEVFLGTDNQRSPNVVTEPSSDEAKQWDGWNTCLKPANEPIVLARKPLSEKTIVDNVLKWGTGGINIDKCRIGQREKPQFTGAKNGMVNVYGKYFFEKSEIPLPDGRFPANVIFDEEAGKMLDEQSGVSKGNGGVRKNSVKNNICYGKYNAITTHNPLWGDSGGASRFFYCAKASRKERGEGNKHPTVKPLKLIKYLVTLTTPPGGVVLDPFIGSGTTALACIELGFNYIGFELSEEYCKIANTRIENIG